LPTESSSPRAEHLYGGKCPRAPGVSSSGWIRTTDLTIMSRAL
jgi:hypothetical protein